MVKSWHVTTRFEQVDVIYFRKRYICLDCDSEHCNHIGWVLNFRSRPDVVARWDGVNVREDFLNPAIFRKIQESPEDSIIRQYIRGAVRQDVCQPPRQPSPDERVMDFVRRTERDFYHESYTPTYWHEVPEPPSQPQTETESLEDRVRDLVRRIHSFEVSYDEVFDEVMSLLPRKEQEPRRKEEPKDPSNPFDLIEL